MEFDLFYGKLHFLLLFVSLGSSSPSASSSSSSSKDVSNFSIVTRLETFEIGLGFESPEVEFETDDVFCSRPLSILVVSAWI